MKSDKSFSFSIAKRLGELGRAGVLVTPHGEIKTPAFTVVGTKGTVKALTSEMLTRMGVQAVLANTYHLYLQPGEDIVAEVGGLREFMNWSGPTFTDSGGFQVFSLGEAFGSSVTKFAKGEVSQDKQEHTQELNVYSKEIATEHGKLAIIDEEGVTFTSHIDGSMHRFTAERSIEIQHKLGADVIFAFDECTSPTAPHEYQKEASARTHRWAKRCLSRHRDLEYEKLKQHQKHSNILQNVGMSKRGGSAPQALFGVVQGGRYEDLRKESAETLGGMDFDGYGIGGSFTKEDLHEALGWVNRILPEEKPRHLLGIGEPEDIFMGVENGCDTFDCVAATRTGRNGTLYTREGKVNITKAQYRDDHVRLAEWCDVFESDTYTRSYLHHLFRAHEMLAGTLASIINLRFIVKLFEDIRTSIHDDTYFEFKQEFLEKYKKRGGR